eukprot:TRINITY_DN2441_c0_g2_i3.p1 TRINITY_DN2441_c0_g2~~TRINITY_DN2441_c0_g2_i3.p1  ORF type:complete len:372 (+),score=109.43 TRINITY_DN2441_c0_g2_i3:926-2041(+)
MVRQVDYIITYSTGGIVTKVDVDVVLEDVTLAAATAAGSLEQKYSVQFLESGKTASSIRWKSGNPGYVIGKPVLAGTSVTSSGKTALEVSNVPGDGLRIIGATSTGSCQSHGTVVNFGQDTQSTCQLQLSLNAMTSGCASIRAQALDYFKGSRTYTHVGKFGDASYLDIGQWLSISGSSFPTLPTASVDPNGVCTSVVVSMDYEFLYARLGARSDPQNRIVGARVSYQTADLRYNCIGGSCQYSVMTSATDLQPFVLASTVRFVLLPDQALVEVVPPPPPGLPTLPDDIFYPFTIEVASDAATSSVSQAITAASAIDGSVTGSASTGTNPSAPTIAPTVSTSTSAAVSISSMGFTSILLITVIITIITQAN